MASSSAIKDWLDACPLDGWIREHVAAVVERLPEEVRADLMGEPGVVVYDYEPGPGVVMQVPVKSIRRGGRGGRW